MRLLSSIFHESEGAFQKCDDIWRALLHLAQPLLCSVCSEQEGCSMHTLLRLEQGGCGDVYGCNAELIPAHLSEHVLRTRRMRQYLYFCTSKASKLAGTCMAARPSSFLHISASTCCCGNARVFCVSICTFVPVKQVNRVPAGGRCVWG